MALPTGRQEQNKTHLSASHLQTLGEGHLDQICPCHSRTSPITDLDRFLSQQYASPSCSVDQLATSGKTLTPPRLPPPSPFKNTNASEEPVSPYRGKIAFVIKRPESLENSSGGSLTPPLRRSPRGACWGPTSSHIPFWCGGAPGRPQCTERKRQKGSCRHTQASGRRAGLGESSGPAFPEPHRWSRARGRPKVQCPSRPDLP